MFCNPPYGRFIQDWVRKGYEESRKPGTVVVMLIPARTDTSYYHDYIFHGKADEVRFLRGRLKFTDEDGNAKDAAPFPSAVIVWRSPDMALSVKDMVLELIKAEPMTANEIAAVLADRGQKVSRSDVGPILTKAQAAGIVANAGKRACSVTGRSLSTQQSRIPELSRRKSAKLWDNMPDMRDRMASNWDNLTSCRAALL